MSSGRTNLHVDATGGTQDGVGCHGRDTGRLWWKCNCGSGWDKCYIIDYCRMGQATL